MANEASVQADHRRTRAGRRPLGERSHRLIPHTADAGFSATAADLPTLFEEAGAALTQIAADVDPGVAATTWAEVAVDAADLAGLAFGWLNELIRIGEVQHGAIIETRVRELIARRPGHPGRDDLGPSWHLRGRVGVRPYRESGVRARRQPKSATYHRLTVERSGAGWAMRVYLDL